MLNMDLVRLAARTIKNHTPLWPLVGITVTGLSLAACSIIRLGVVHPEVAIDRKKAKENKPWERVKPGTVIKFFDPIDRKSGKYKDESNRRPEYKS